MVTVQNVTLQLLGTKVLEFFLVYVFIQKVPDWNLC
jgi:hypothetical protein